MCLCNFWICPSTVGFKVTDHGRTKDGYAFTLFVAGDPAAGWVLYRIVGICVAGIHKIS